MNMVDPIAAYKEKVQFKKEIEAIFKGYSLDPVCSSKQWVKNDKMLLLLTKGENLPAYRLLFELLQCTKATDEDCTAFLRKIDPYFHAKEIGGGEYKSDLKKLPDDPKIQALILAHEAKQGPDDLFFSCRVVTISESTGHVLEVTDGRYLSRFSFENSEYRFVMRPEEIAKLISS